MSLGTQNPFFAEPNALRRWTTGPLGPYVNAFATRLWELGYSPSVGGNYVRCVGYLSSWMELRGFEAQELDEYKICDHLRSLKHHADTTVSGAPHWLFLSYLREVGVIKRSPPAITSKVDRVVGEYIEYLRQERGLAEPTLVHRRMFARRFLEERFKNQPMRLSRLKAQDFIRYIQKRTGGYGVLSRAGIVHVLKDFCRFLRLREYVRQDIASGLPKMPYWRASGVPNHLERPEVERLLKNCERKSPKGMRDHAILLLLVRLGLRAGEVRNLTLDDIDWETGQITICGKGSKRNRLPLPQEVGKAVVEYLKHGRPPCSSRHLFIRDRAPHTGMLCSGAIYKIVGGALKRADLHPPHRGPHMLRHSFATHLLRRGASLPEIGRLLGHESPDSTAVYTHVASDGLKPVVQPWPGGAL